MNSPLINNRTQAKPGLPLGEILTNAPSDRGPPWGRFTSACCLVSRPPMRSKSAAAILASFVGDRREAFEDIYWSLINSTEFLTRR